MRKWLVIDVSYMCHRAFHTAGHLSWKGKPTGVVFQFLKSITTLKDEFQTDLIAFCFEHPHLYRRDLYPQYKHRRHTDKSPQEQIAYNQLQIQITELRKRYLPKIGFKNVFCCRGMESDDIMAALAKSVDPYDEMILVTADSDMYQVLAPNVSIYSPQKRKIITCEQFVGKYKIYPREWAIVKALSGCISDEVKGISGIGEITALSYLRGDLKPDSRAYNAIRSAEGKAIVRRNRALVQLPFKDCPVPDLQEDELDIKGWKEVCALLGMKSIAGHPPIATMKRIGKR